MIYTALITSRGKITIPSALRKKVGLIKSGYVSVREGNGKLIVEPIKDLLDVRGSLKTKVLSSSSRIRQKFEEDVAQRKLSYAEKQAELEDLKNIPWIHEELAKVRSGN